MTLSAFLDEHDGVALVFDPEDCLDVIAEVKYGSVWTVLSIDHQFALDLEVLGPSGQIGVTSSEYLKVLT